MSVARREPQHAWQALAPLMDLVTPMALRVAATLRLADEMPDQDNGAIPASELARRARAYADALT
jgi:2,7-dihydroxy-5-methyl-1-naphthoate 7-O-methyltransferase